MSPAPPHSQQALRLLDNAALPPPRALPSWLGARRSERETFCAAHNLDRYRAQQIFSGVFRQRIQSFGDLTTLSKNLRSRLESSFSLQRPTLETTQVSEDGTRKFLFSGTDGAGYEAVYIPNVAKTGKTHTLCISSQTGCAVGCRFCYTASIRRNRNLDASEIVGQVLAARDILAEDGLTITNIVFMGMGEPLLNYANVTRAIDILIDNHGCDFSNRRVTVSTSGIVPRMYDLGRDVNTQLAVSLNATTNEIRNRIMPINKKWPIEELIAAMRAYPLVKRRRITVEYVLLKDVNDSVDDANRLMSLLDGIPVKLNLLPLNEHDRT